VALGDPANPLEHASSDLHSRQDRSPALRPRQTEAEIDGIELRLSEYSLGEAALDDDIFPEVAMAGVATLATAREGIREGARRGVGWKPEGLVPFLGEEPDGLVLHEQAPQAVEDRPPLVDLDPIGNLSPVPDKDIGTGIDCSAGEFDDKFCRLLR